MKIYIDKIGKINTKHIVVFLATAAFPGRQYLKKKLEVQKKIGKKI
jgi:hypothetical protein